MAIHTSLLRHDFDVPKYSSIVTATTTTAAAVSTMDDSKSILEKPMNSILGQQKKKTKKKKKRGTRTTGVGASTSALLNANNFYSIHAEDEHPAAEKEEDVNDINNPMLGKMWVKTTSASSVVFKLYPSSNNNTRVVDDSEAIYIELSESLPKHKGRARKRRGRELHVRCITNYENVTDNDPKLQQQSSSSSIPISTMSKFMPIEGIYGVYHLPLSGPHIVLITESERVYKSPPIILPSSSDYIPLLELRKITCLEIVSLRNSGTNRRIVMDYDDGVEKVKEDRISTTTTQPATIMREEEARQLRLLRKSFAEHDLYFTVPFHYYHNHYIQRRRKCRLKKDRQSKNNFEHGNIRNGDDGDNALGDDVITVPDVTHTLQRSFMGMNGRNHPSATNTPNNHCIHRRWWTHYVSTTEDVVSTHTATAATKKDEEEEEDDSDDSDWGSEQELNRRAGTRVAPQTVIDPRFFWNEFPALSLLPPSSSSHSFPTDNDSRDESSSSSSSSTTTATMSSPYAHLLDHLIPVTSAFVGVRQNIPIPKTAFVAASSSSKSLSSNNTDSVESQQVLQQDIYDQVLISRRSKYRAGTRFTRRGTDDTGNVANYAETEQLCFIVSRTNNDLPVVNEDVTRVNDKSNGDNSKEGNSLATTTKVMEQNTPPAISATLLEIYSHVQTRGSIPLHWSSPVMTVGTYRPRVYICVDPMKQARGLRDHLLGDLQRYSLSSLSSLASSSLMSFGGADVLGAKSKITMVNLIDKHGDQGRLGRAFDSVLSAVLDAYNTNQDEKEEVEKESSATAIENDDVGCGNGVSVEDEEIKIKHPQHWLTPSSIKHFWYDFHAECKGGRYDRLSQLLEQIIPTLNDQGYFCATFSPTKPSAKTTLSAPTWEIRSLQDGVVRTNCMDCLDRTNVVQSMFGRYMLYRQLHQRIGLSTSSNSRSHRRTLPLECVVGYKKRPLTLPWTEGEAAHRLLWADNADAISRLYAGTPALKGDFTRTGKRTRRGAFDDGLNSLQRYYLNNFIDADRQEGMDLLVGSVEFDVTMPISSTISGNDEDSDRVSGNVTDEYSRLLMLRELEKRSCKRRGYDGTHARIKVKSGETFGGSNGDGSNGSNDGAATQNKSPKMMPKDLHYYMKHEAHLSRSPLSAAAREENLDAPTSADFLLQVTSSAAGDEVPLSDSGGDAMNVGRSLSITGVSPWWVASSLERDDGAVANAENGKSMHVLLQKILGIASQPVVVIPSLLLLFRAAPVLFAALILAILVTSGQSLSSSSLFAQHKDRAG